MSRIRKPHFDRNKTAANRFAALNRVMEARVSRQEVSESDADDMELGALAAIECITKGYGTEAHYNELAHVINTAWILATERGIGEEAKPYLLVAQDAMKRMARRFKKTGKFGFDALGLEAVRRIVEIASTQLTMCSVGEVRKAGEIADRHFWNTPAEAA